MNMKNVVSNTFFTVHYDDSVTETVAQDTLKYLTSLRNTVLSTFPALVLQQIQ